MDGSRRWCAGAKLLCFEFASMESLATDARRQFLPRSRSIGRFRLGPGHAVLIRSAVLHCLNESEKAYQASIASLRTLLRHEWQEVPPERLRHGRYQWGQIQEAGAAVAGGEQRETKSNAREAVRAGQLGTAADFSGHGRSRQGRSDQARNVRRKSTGLRRARFQGTYWRGAGPRLSLAGAQRGSITRKNRNFQPLALRRGAGGARASSLAEGGKAARPCVHETHLGRAL